MVDYKEKGEIILTGSCDKFSLLFKCQPDGVETFRTYL